MKKITIVFFIVVLLFFPVHTEVRAESTNLEVNTQQELASAISEINNNTDREFLISIKQDIEINDVSLFSNGCTINNNNKVTIIGNGHKLIFALTGKKIVVTNAELNLGNLDGSDTLEIQGSSSQTSSSESMIQIGNGVLNMYKGVTISKHNSTAHYVGGGVRVLNDGIFNMYGGSISNNSGTGSLALGGAVALDDSNGIFNMYGGEIKNNTVSHYGGAIYVSNGSVVNITGGVISGNEGAYGGAIANLDSTVNICNATIENNVGSYGGAILNYGNGYLEIEKSI